MTAQGKITAANMTPGTVVRIVMESDATAELFERQPEYTAARIKRGSVLAEIITNEGIGSGRRRIGTKFGTFVVVGHQTFILAKNGETAEEPAPAAHITVSASEPREEDESNTTGGETETAEATVAAFLYAAPEFHINPEEIPADVKEAVKFLEGAPAMQAKRVDNAPFFLTEEEIEANQRQADADAEKADREMRESAQRERELIRESSSILTEAGKFLADNLPDVDFDRLNGQLQEAWTLHKSQQWTVSADRGRKIHAEAAHIVRLRKEFGQNLPEWRKERIVVALARYGTVPYPEGTPEYTKYSQELTSELSQYKTTGEKRYRIEFERIGSTEGPRPLYVATFERPGAIITKIHRYAAKFLKAKNFAIHVNLAEGTVEIENGRFGRGRMVIESA